MKFKPVDDVTDQVFETVVAHAEKARDRFYYSPETAKTIGDALLFFACAMLIQEDASVEELQARVAEWFGVVIRAKREVDAEDEN
jgi:hypothetical protein